MPPKVMEKAASVSYPRVNELIHGKRGVTPDTALRLERLLGMEAQFWLNLQLAWDLYHVKWERKLLPLVTPSGPSPKSTHGETLRQ